MYIYIHMIFFYPTMLFFHPRPAEREMRPTSITRVCLSTSASCGCRNSSMNGSPVSLACQHTSETVGVPGGRNLT